MAAGHDKTSFCTKMGPAHEDDSKQNILPSVSSLIVVKAEPLVAPEPNTDRGENGGCEGDS